MTARAEPITLDCGLDFESTVTECLMNRELVEQFNRTYCARIVVRAAPNHPIEAMICAATGAPPVTWTPRERDGFLQFVMEFVWLPLCERRANPC